MTATKDKDIINLIRTTVREQEPDAEIILYGSRARGDARPDSDWDVIVLRNKDKLTYSEKGNIDYALWRRGRDMGQEINTYEYTQKEWNSLPPSLFKHNVIKDGIRL